MSEERKISDDFYELFETPDSVKPYLYKIVTEEEEALLLFLRNDPKSTKQVAEHFGLSPEVASELLDKTYHRANIHKSRENHELFYAANLYDRLGYFTQYEQDVWQTVPPKDRKIIDEWYVGEFTARMKKQMDDEGAAFYRDAVLPIESANEEIDRIAAEVGLPFYMTPCNCRTTTDACTFSRNTCVSNYYDVNGQWDRGYGQKLTQEELHELMKSCDREGLMHTISPTGHICNCDTCCCYEFRAALKLGTKGRYPKVLYVAAFDSELCVNCGICVKRCHFGAFFRNADEQISFDPFLCWGCGICEATCPKDAIRIVSIDSEKNQ